MELARTCTAPNAKCGPESCFSDPRSVLDVLGAELGDAVIRDGELLLGGGEDYSEVVGVLEALQQERGWREPNKPREQKETVRECGTEKGERTT